jgi:signal transduction histidine kinase
MAKKSDYLSRAKKQYVRRLLITLLVSNVILISLWYVLSTTLHEHWLSNLKAEYALILLGAAIIISLIGAFILANNLITPLRAIWELIIRMTPSSNVAAPNIDSLRVGRELVANLYTQILQLNNSLSAKLKSESTATLSRDFIANNLPLPLFILDSQETIVFANKQAAEYIGLGQTEMNGKNFYMIMDMSFPSDNTFESWLKQVKASSATANTSWERVRLNVLDNHPTLMFDLAAFYNRDNPEHYETILVLFDHTKQYSQDDQAVSFVALSVHELRTPLTLLRGYIEALEDEMDTSNPEMQDFMQKMSATAQQLTSFVNNILNVARIDNDQLYLKLHEENWGDILVSAVNDINLRAKVRGITIEVNIAPDLPTVGVDRLSIYEVINNLLDNAIKYSADSKLIKVNAHLSQEGLVETSIQDFGLGINPSIMQNLFTKFYRDHRNRSQIGGTGLGLYLSKAIISAHGGNIWVSSELGKGSIFSFTVVPYAQLADEIKNSDNKEVIRGTHGWIKNHSLYRR